MTTTPTLSGRINWLDAKLGVARAILRDERPTIEALHQEFVKDRARFTSEPLPGLTVRAWPEYFHLDVEYMPQEVSLNLLLSDPRTTPGYNCKHLLLPVIHTREVEFPGEESPWRIQVSQALRAPLTEEDVELLRSIGRITRVTETREVSTCQGG
jgi:hypothetical protein